MSDPPERAISRNVIEGVGIVIMASLLAWVGVNTHLSAVELKGVSTRVEAMMDAYTKDVGRLDGEIQSQETRSSAQIEALRARLRVLEMRGRARQE